MQDENFGDQFNIGFPKESDLADDKKGIGECK
jgi:murein L,D-transpeptidase YafK